MLLYTAGDKKLYSYSVADGKTAVITSTDLGRLGSVAVSPDSKWVTFSKQDRTVRTHVYIAPITGGEERHISDDSLLYAENNAVWTADGRYIVFTSSEGTNNGIATQGGLRRRCRCGRCRCAIRIAIRPTAISTTRRRVSPRKPPHARTPGVETAEEHPRRSKCESTGAVSPVARGKSRCRERSSPGSPRRPRDTRSR